LPLKTIPFLLFSCLLAFSARADGQVRQETSGGKVDVAARVNSVTIPLSLVTHRVAQSLAGQKMRVEDLSPIELAQARLRMLEWLINNEVLVQLALREGIQVSDAEVDQDIRNLFAEAPDRNFRERMKEFGVTDEEFRLERRQAILIRKLKARVVLQVPAATDSEIIAFFNQNRSHFKIERGVALGIIAVDPAESGVRNDAVGVVQARAKIAHIAERLKFGEDFGVLAFQMSEDAPTAQNNGETGFISENTLKETFGAALATRFMDMKVGDVTEPIPGASGRIFFFKLLEKRVVPLEADPQNPGIRNEIKTQIRRQREGVLLEALMASANNGFLIENVYARRIWVQPSFDGSPRR
jgi:parvulin-like peptidyl-prolyl isomerase